MERVNISVRKQIEHGRQIIAEAGGVRAYDEKARRAHQVGGTEEAR
jgi:hypothetical protein